MSTNVKPSMLAIQGTLNSQHTFCQRLVTIAAVVAHMVPVNIVQCCIVQVL